MSVHICDWCGVVTVDAACRCAHPVDSTQVVRRHREAVARARHTDSIVHERDRRPVRAA